MLGIILNVILVILKIIGILLLAILGLVVFLTLVILFVPIRYKSIGDFEKNEGVTHHIYAKVTWCLHIVSITFNRIENKNDFVIKIFGINIDKFKRKQKKSSKRSESKSKADGRLLSKVDKQQSDKTKEYKKLNNIDNAIEEKTLSNTESTYKTNETNINDAKPTQEEAENKEVKISLIDKIKLKVKEILTKIEKICEKIKKYNNVKNSFVEYLKKEESKKAIKEIKKILYKLMKHILPKKLKAKLGFGFDDASTTGIALGALSVFYAIYDENLELEPDFDKEVLYGKYNLKGRIYMYYLLLVAWKLYKDAWIRDFVVFSKKTVKDL